METVSNKTAIKYLKADDTFKFDRGNTIYKVISPECIPNFAAVEELETNVLSEVDNNEEVYLINQTTKTETNMETTNNNPEMIPLNEVNGNVETIRMKVSNSLGSLFTKDDVIRVIDMIVVEKQKPIEQSNSNFNLAEKFDELLRNVSEELDSMEDEINDAIDEDKIELDSYDIEFHNVSGNKYEFEVENPNFSIPFQSDIECTLADSKTSILQELKSFKENNLTK